MTVEIHPDQEALVIDAVQQGRYASPEEAVAAGIRLLDLESDTQERDFPEGRLNLAELFAQSPFKGVDIEFPRDRSPMRDLDL